MCVRVCGCVYVCGAAYNLRGVSLRVPSAEREEGHPAATGQCALGPRVGDGRRNQGANIAGTPQKVCAYRFSTREGILQELRKRYICVLTVSVPVSEYCNN